MIKSARQVPLAGLRMPCHLADVPPTETKRLLQQKATTHREKVCALQHTMTTVP